MSQFVLDIQSTARADLDNHVLWLRERAGSAIAGKFVDAVERSFSRLCHSPGIGSPLGSRNPRLHAIRKWKIADFPNVFIFYEPLPDRIAIIRVLHAAQHWWSLFEV